MSGSGEKRAILATVIGALAIVGTAFVALEWQTGCQLQGVCAPSSSWWPGPNPPAFPGPTAQMPNSGAVDENTWQSGSLDDPWLYFPGGRTYTIYPYVTNVATTNQDRFFGPDWDITVWVGTDPQPASQGNYTLASGNIAEVFLVSDPTESQFLLADGGVRGDDAGGLESPPVFNVVNATCAPYYMRVEVTRHPSEDAGADAADAAATDADSDASLDAGVD